jgi:hypothetical protein
MLQRARRPSSVPTRYCDVSLDGKSKARPEAVRERRPSEPVAPRAAEEAAEAAAAAEEEDPPDAPAPSAPSLPASGAARARLRTMRGVGESPFLMDHCVTRPSVEMETICSEPVGLSGGVWTHRTCQTASVCAPSCSLSDLSAGEPSLLPVRTLATS